MFFFFKKTQFSDNPTYQYLWYSLSKYISIMHFPQDPSLPVRRNAANVVSTVASTCANSYSELVKETGTDGDNNMEVSQDMATPNHALSHWYSLIITNFGWYWGTTILGNL